MLKAELISELNRFRHDLPGASACAAPSMNMHFSQLGVVTACCFNRTHVLGVYPHNTVDEIWHGEPVRELRKMMENYDLGSGCEKCLQQIEARDFGGAHAVFYSLYAHASERKRQEWGMPVEGDPVRAPLPLRLEFNIHNSCNLQCVMCHSLASSAIRTRREGLAPLDNPYDQAFADQLEAYLPYVVESDFMGGEPFLIPLYTTLWEQIARTNPRMKTCILTNGTILDDRIKTLLESFNCWMHVSIDSVFKKTYETIRRGANYEQVMENCDYYLQLMEQRGFPFTFRFCPMRLNWQEIPDTVRFCNEKRIELMFNQLDSPINLSLVTLPTSELRSVVDYLERNAPVEETTRTEKTNLRHYRELVMRLSGFLDSGNRLNGLAARLDTSAAVVGRYSRGGKEKASLRTALPEPEENRDALTQAAKRFVITRLNLDQARESGLDVPAAFASRLSESRALLDTERAGSGTDTFITVFLNEVVRTYSGVWGVVDVHDEDVFEKVGFVASALKASRNPEGVIGGLLEAPLGGVYRALSTRPGAGVVDSILGRKWDSDTGGSIHAAPAGSGAPDGNRHFEAPPRSSRVAVIERPVVSEAPKIAAGSGPGTPAAFGDREKAADFRLSYGRAADPVRVSGGYTLAPRIQGPSSLVGRLRRENVLLSIEKITIDGEGQRTIGAGTADVHDIGLLYDRVRVSGVRDGASFAFDFERGKVPPDLERDRFKTLCWGLSMGGRHYSLGPLGDYGLRKDEDAQMEAMSRIIDSPVWLCESAVRAGSEWAHDWTGTREHRDNHGCPVYHQTVRLEEATRRDGFLRASLQAETSGSLVGADAGSDRISIQIETSTALDAERGLVLDAGSKGTIRTQFQPAGFAILWELTSRYAQV